MNSGASFVSLIPRTSFVLVLALSFAIVSTVFLGVHLAVHSATSQQSLTNTQNALSSYIPGSAVFSLASLGGKTAQPAFQFFLQNSPFLSTAGWVFVGGAWIWRGKVRSRWESLGFDSGLFDLFMKMKGAGTRTSLLDSLSAPKDRLQLARELGLDWKAVDYHINLLSRYGLVHEDHAFGNVKLYQLTKQGEMLLQLLKEFNRQVPAGASQNVQSKTSLRLDP